MPRSTQHKAKGHGEVISPSSVLDRIDYWLKEMRRTFPQKELEPEEIANWHRDLERFPIEAIDWSFENWRRNGRFFPVYGDILDQCASWKPEPPYKPGCSKECLSRHGKGYNQYDMIKFFKMYVAKRKEVNGPLKKQEILELFDKLDKLRGGSPEWRKKTA